MDRFYSILVGVIISVIPTVLFAGGLSLNTVRYCPLTLSIPLARRLEQLESTASGGKNSDAIYEMMARLRAELPSYNEVAGSYFEFRVSGLYLVAGMQPFKYRAAPNQSSSLGNLENFSLEYIPKVASAAVRAVFGGEPLVLNASHVLSSSDGMFTELPGTTTTVVLQWKTRGGVAKTVVIDVSRDSGQVYLMSPPATTGSVYSEFKAFMSGMRQEARSRWNKWQGLWHAAENVSDVKWIDEGDPALTPKPVN